jgi:HEAT repeat protein
LTGPDVTARAATRRRAAALAGHEGDQAGARRAWLDDEPAVRATGLGALERLGSLDSATLRAALLDPSPLVRRRAAELAAHRPDVSLRDALDDPDAGVIEMAAFACGEQGAAVGTGVVAKLVDLAADHPDALVREAAVAALGAIGGTAGLPAILAAAGGDKPAVRRRAVIALAPFAGPDVDAALRQALTDRDWQVRQAAEDLLEP